MATTTITVRIDEELLAAVDKHLGKTVKGKGAVNRSAYILQLLRDDLNRKPTDNELNGKDKAAIYGQDVKISKLVGDLALKALQKKGEKIFDGATDAELFKLITGQMPKPKEIDEELDNAMLSMKRALELLPGIEDITAELSKQRQKVNKLEAELEINAIMMQSMRNQLKGLSAEAWEAFKQAADRMAELANRNARDGQARGIDVEFLRPLILSAGGKS